MPRSGLTPRHIAFAALSSLLYVFAFPKFNLSWLAWLALVPLVMIVIQLPPRRAFFLGWAAGTASYVGLLYWIVVTFQAAQQSLWLAVPCTLLLAAYVGLFWGVWTWSLATLKERVTSQFFPWAVSAAWVGLEYVRTHLFSGFPWVLLGDSQWQHLAIIQIASITGVYGVSFLVVLVNTTIAHSVTPTKAGVQGRQRRWIPASGPRPIGYVAARTTHLLMRWYAGMTAIIVIASIFFGLHRLKTFSNEPPTPSFTIALLQGNIDQYAKWDARYVSDIQRTYDRLVTEAVQKKPSLIIWPETSVPGFLIEDPTLAKWLVTLIRHTRTHHLVGAPAGQGLVDIYNTAYSMNPEGVVLATYAKQHLVPFGEVIPFKNVLSRWIGVLNKLGGFAAGTQSPVVPSGIGPIGVNICYEAIFPDLVRRSVKAGAGVIVNITNDGWYMRTSAPYQHFIPNIFRAVENDRWVARANNTGISAMIDPRGRVEVQSGIFVPAVVTGTLSPRTSLTFYTRFGDVFAWGCLLLCVVLPLRGILRRQ